MPARGLDIVTLPYKLQKLPDEAHAILRFLWTQDMATVPAIERGARLTNRVAMRGIRRLINDGLIEMFGRSYGLTTDGKILARQLIEFDSRSSKEVQGSNFDFPASEAFYRRLIVVLPRAFAPQVPTPLFVGINPPTPGAPTHPEGIRVEMRLSAVGGTLSHYVLTLDVPSAKAAVPGRVMLTPAEPGRSVRVRVDAVQIKPDGKQEPLGGMYFDVKVPLTAAGQDPTVRAVGMDMPLRA